jgi:hypothetical protein
MRARSASRAMGVLMSLAKGSESAGQSFTLLTFSRLTLGALRFIETFDDTISLQPGEPIDPKDPIELIDLVLETYGEQTIGLFDLVHTAQILVVHPHTGMAFDLFRYARHGDAAFFLPDHVGGSPDDLRIDVGPHSLSITASRFKTPI